MEKESSSKYISENDSSTKEFEPRDFIRNIIDADIKSNKHDGKVITRFPPEPNGYLHMGHTKSICLNFGLAREYPNARCHLRFDDTNPEKEEQEFVDSIKADIKWLGFDWGEHLYFASDYYEQLYQFAIELINKGKAYVCSLPADKIREYRGTLTEPGKNSPYRDRSPAENLDLFQRMRAGEFKDGEHILRAKIDMTSPNINMRDPAIYRIRHAHHHRTGDKWCIYPMYDYTHCISDALEGITHSLCTLEFEDHRPLYDWVLDNITIDCHPQQIEFAKLQVTNVVLGKRKLRKLVEGKHVLGWDDPRMPTISGMRRKGYTPAAIVDFCKRIGVAKADSTVDSAMLEFCLREDLNKKAPRRMVVMDPILLVIQNYPDGQSEMLDAENNPEAPETGHRKISFSKRIYIEREDFMEDAPKKFFRMTLGNEVRLKHAYYVKCTEIIKDENGNVKELHCTYDPTTKGGWSEDGRKVKGTIHWVNAEDCIDIELRTFDYLFNTELIASTPEEEEDLLFGFNKNSLHVNIAKAENNLLNDPADVNFQFIRKGYYIKDKDSSASKLVFNETVGMKDSWNKTQTN